ncbi:hypothetical protein VTG60DRAFT_6952 [Thermothelomyces hinnuleus]
MLQLSYRIQFSSLTALPRQPDSRVAPIEDDKEVLDPSRAPEGVVLPANGEHGGAPAVLALPSEPLVRDADLAAAGELDDEVGQDLVARVEVVVLAVVPLRVGHAAPVQVGDGARDGPAGGTRVDNDRELLVVEVGVVVARSHALHLDGPQAPRVDY